MPEPELELLVPELPEPELPEPELELLVPELLVPDSSEPEPEPELADPELLVPELFVPESSEPEPELADPELLVPESSEPEPELADPDPELLVSEFSESSPRSMVVPEWSESSPRSMVVPGPTATVRSTDAVVVVVVVVAVVVAVVVDGIVVGLGTVGGTGSGSPCEAGLRHTDADVGAPRFGNRLSRIAYTAPAEPTTTTNATMAADTRAPSHELCEPAPAPSTSRRSDGVRANTVARCAPSGPCPRSSQ